MKDILNLFKSQKGSSCNSKNISFEDAERLERIFYLEYLRQGMTVFDAGANVGDLTLLFSRTVNPGKVHSFEASLAAFEKLETICRLSNRRNVILNHLALSDREGAVRLNIYDDNYLAFNSQAMRNISEFGKAIEPIDFEEMTATTIDHYCEENRIPEIDLLKIDVEGTELDVMRGAQKMLQEKQIKCLTFEFGETTAAMNVSAEEIEDYLAEAGYEIKNIIQGEPAFPGRGTNNFPQYSMHVARPR